MSALAVNFVHQVISAISVRMDTSGMMTGHALAVTTHYANGMMFTNSAPIKVLVKIMMIVLKLIFNLFKLNQNVEFW